MRTRSAGLGDYKSEERTRGLGTYTLHLINYRRMENLMVSNDRSEMVGVDCPEDSYVLRLDVGETSRGKLEHGEIKQGRQGSVERKGFRGTGHQPKQNERKDRNYPRAVHLEYPFIMIHNVDLVRGSISV